MTNEKCWWTTLLFFVSHHHRGYMVFRGEVGTLQVETFWLISGHRFGALRGSLFLSASARVLSGCFGAVTQGRSQRFLRSVDGGRPGLRH